MVAKSLSYKMGGEMGVPSFVCTEQSLTTQIRDLVTDLVTRQCKEMMTVNFGNAFGKDGLQDNV